ncbi:hypothetical protein A2690_02905 [Candidatus Roizmanbacteria bacterium RIFCSPHIGHO2_01_FULL_39_12b]|uniref:Gram-positive cocci surface proteins LPxTG domain-containing protein n=1 Tax=Candidatus Roizmanbacteria bacterium RIFCSPHIGHO2_01_FULL_39_12b TaxID=1802030 RepID=A0A1F7G890_9BACT|nr:MAG: hypothetical protein A2690_02905 [Candidatus Roizmanbacteria bacterium RIFCSPHIGHO2_01_FULL_39_12b]OGK45931.1 MAG: hypothetical protein A3B46_02720 [Candidatus Roizmanbacteria bacterium RIFCSPLOWO2_01_FULL_39_19]
MRNNKNNLIAIVISILLFAGILSIKNARATTDELCWIDDMNVPCDLFPTNEPLNNEELDLDFSDNGLTPTQTPTPTGGNIIEDNIFDVCLPPFLNNCPTATPTTGPSATPTPTGTPPATPTTTPQPTIRPTEVPVGGGSSQGSSSSSSSPSTGGGQVLGATTLATTGVFEETIANMVTFSGALLMGVGSMLYGKKNS